MSLLNKTHLLENLTTTTMPTPQHEHAVNNNIIDVAPTEPENAINHVSATITSIRSNVTRVLVMYFQNVSDEFGYGAANAQQQQLAPPQHEQLAPQQLRQQQQQPLQQQQFQLPAHQQQQQQQLQQLHHQQPSHHHQQLQQLHQLQQQQHQLTSSTFEPAATTTMKIATTITTRTTTATAATAATAATTATATTASAAAATTAGTTSTKIGTLTPGISTALTQMTQATRDTATNLINRATNAVNAAIETATTATAATAATIANKMPNGTALNSIIPTLNATATAAAAASTTTTTASSTATSLLATTSATTSGALLTTAPTITYPSYRSAIKNSENCSALFANYTQPQQGIFCNWTWDTILCWPPTPAGVLARMHCPSGWHGVDTRKFANRKCELDGHWGGRPNETQPSQNGWTDYQPCFKPEVNLLMQQIKNVNVNLYVEIARRTRTLEIVGLILSLLALIISLIIFCNFRSLRNNRTKIHKNLFIAMVFQVIIRLTLYLDQAFKRGKQEAAMNTSNSGIEKTPYLCEASYVLLEYARTAMFMWMFIEGLYLHNMVTVAVFQGNFPHKVFSLIGWGMPVLMTTIWALCTAMFMDTTKGDCWWNYNLTPYYWILEGPRLIVILLNFVFLVNIISVLVVKLRQSQASDIEQTRKAVRAAIVLLPLLGITNLLHLVPDLQTPWKFALWSYVTHFLTSFQGFFIALIYCFLNGEVRAVLFKSVAVYMSVRGHSEWVPKRASMYSGAYNTAPDTDALQQQTDSKRVSPPNRRLNSRKASCASIIMTHNAKFPQQNLHNIHIEQQNHHQLQFANETQRLTTPTATATSNRRQLIVSRGGHSPKNNNNKNADAAAIIMENISATTSAAAAAATAATTTAIVADTSNDGIVTGSATGNGNNSGNGTPASVTMTLIEQKKNRRFFKNGIASKNRARSNNVIHSDNSFGCIRASDRIKDNGSGGSDGGGRGRGRGGGGGVNGSGGGGGGGGGGSSDNGNWMITLCFRGQKNKCVMPGKKMPQQIFMTSQAQIKNNNKSTKITATTTTTTATIATTTTTNALN